jgi:hypothetical protein
LCVDFRYNFDSGKVGDCIMSDRKLYLVSLLGRESVAIAAALVLLILAIITSACQIFPDDQSSGSDVAINASDELAEPTDFPPGFPIPDPDELAACLADGGRWEVLGFSGPGCNLPTGDGGQPCTHSDQCESGCLGDPDELMSMDNIGQLIPDHDRLTELNSQAGNREGICSPWMENFGCRVWVENGVYVAICVD